MAHAIQIIFLLLILAVCIFNSLNQIRMNEATQQLKDAVAAQTTVIESAVTLLNGLGDRLEAAIAAGDMEAVKEITADVRANTDSLSAAVAENTIPAENGGEGSGGEG